ncbi:MAG: AraC family transcriptional regulator [Bacteroidota bacterium]
MKFQEVKPSKELEQLVVHYWKFEVDNRVPPGQMVEHETLPESSLSVVFINHPGFTGIRLQGPHQAKFKIDIPPESIFIGIKFQPWIQIDSICADKQELLNLTSPAPSFLGEEIFPEIDPHSLQIGFSDFELLEVGLRRLLAGVSITLDPMVKYLCLSMRMQDKVSIRELVKDVPLSLRPIQKRFKAVTGISMSEYRNIERVRNTFISIQANQGHPIDYIYENGYYDHAHFINDFKKYMDRPLSDFLKYIDGIELEEHKIDAFLQ